MPQQRLSTFNERFKGSSFARGFLCDLPEYGDFVGDQMPVAFGQTVPLIYPDCVPRQNNALVHIHSRIIPVQPNLGKR